MRPEAYLAAQHAGGPVDPDDPGVAEFRRLVDSMAAKSGVEPLQVAELIVHTTHRLERRHVHANVLTTTLGIERALREGPKSDLFEVAAAYDPPAPPAQLAGGSHACRRKLRW